MQWRLLLMIFPLLFLKGGCMWPPREWQHDSESMYNPLHDGGGQDALAIHLPFAAGYQAQCVQGVGGNYSHQGVSTYYDIDLDTPNDRDVPVYAPVPGVARVHSDPTSGFGLHVNVDVGDGTYVVLGHMSRVQVVDGERVAEGTFLGFEGTTGNSSGDHVHLGRHRGNAAEDAARGTSVEGLRLSMDNVTVGETDVLRAVRELTCSLGGGHVYRSRLPVARRVPDGLLFKVSDQSTVYKMVGGAARPFYTEGVFLGSNEEWSDVLVFPPGQLDCLPVGPMLTVSQPTLAVRSSDDGTPWLVHAGPDGQWGSAERLPDIGWQGVLRTWNIPGATLNDLPTDLMVGIRLAQLPRQGMATYRVGSLVRNRSQSTVYVVQADGAWPVDHERTLQVLGLGAREVVMVEDGEFAQIARNAGSCAAGVRCFTHAMATACPSDPVEVSMASNMDDLSDEVLPVTDASPPEPIVPDPFLVKNITVTLENDPGGNWPLWVWNESAWQGDWPGLTDTVCAIGGGTVHSCNPAYVESGDLIWLNGEVPGGWLVEARADGGVTDRIADIAIGGVEYPLRPLRGNPPVGECMYRFAPSNDVHCRMQ